MMKENKETKLGVKKITAQKEKLDVQGQGCWDDCRIWKNYTMILSILVYTFFTRMFDFMLPLVVKYSIVAA